MSAKTARIGIVSDIHGDLHALDLALDHLRRLGCDKILCAGDFVGLFGDEVIARLRAEDVITTLGNHDRWAQHPETLEGEAFAGDAELSGGSRAWLATLAHSWSAELEGVRVAMWHARPGSDMDGIEARTTGPELRRHLLDQARADVLVVGHTHEAFVLPAGEKLIVNPGACCSTLYAYERATPTRKLRGAGAPILPRSTLLVPAGRSVATFGVLELPARRFSVYRASDGAPVKLAGRRR